MERIDIEKFITDDLIAMPNNSTLYDDLKNQILARKNTDILMKQDKTEEHCHGDVLRYHSEYFSHCLPTGSVINLPYENVHPVVFKFLYEWMIMGSTECPRNKLLELLDAGFFLYMPMLVSSIFQCMDDKKTFTASDSIDTYYKALNKNVLGIADLMLASVRKYFLLMINTVEYSEIEVSCLCNLLDSDNLGVQSEIEVFYAVFVWIYVDFEARMVHLERILKAVRFKLLPSEFLCNIGMHLHELHPDIAAVLHPILQETMWFHQVLDMEEDVGENIKPCQRIWIRDPQCPYIDLVKKGKHIDHVDFMQYVVTLDNAEEFSDRLLQKESNESGDETPTEYSGSVDEYNVETTEDSLVETTENAEESHTECTESVEDTLTEGTESEEESLTEGTESVEESLTEGTESVEDSITEDTESVEDSFTEGTESAEESRTEGTESVEVKKV
ncbi:uncharacterized protein LOC117790873 [Drosophila innubila]|uniref:uncharacterized protein LOC117790873 n=1 Tax=Drosophila innubila TaxID=198719 RepID=UPI00148C95B1|nr:uncharacterized protein LOC117790873 [Drosophila innubila]